MPCARLKKLLKRQVVYAVVYVFKNARKLKGYQEALRPIGEMALPKKTVLVLDDYHLVSATHVSGFLRFLIVSEIQDLHIILTACFVE